MKLNLLPSYVSKGSAAKTWFVASLLFVIASILAAVGLIVMSTKARDEAEAAAKELEPQAQQVVALAKSAEGIGASAAPVTRNVQLAKAMMDHPFKYTSFYRSVTPYIPSFFRVNAMSVTPAGETGCTLTLSGTIQSYQQYADLMLALLRIPGAQRVGRAGYVLDRATIPGVTQEFPNPVPSKDSQGPLPLDPSERIQELIARAAAVPTGFTGAGNYAGPVDQARQAIPNWQNITVSVDLNTPGLAAPNPGATNTTPAGPPPGVVQGPNPGAQPGTQPGGVTPGTQPAVGAVPGVSYDLRAPRPQATLGGSATPGGGAASVPSAPRGGGAPRPGRAEDGI